jgi:HAMP domain-containing protein
VRAVVLLLAALGGSAHAAWQWSEPLTVNSVRGATIYPHMESANRHNVAVSGTTVGVVWEDNRSGGSQCYLAMKPASAADFQPEIQLSQAECYEPVVVALEGGRFAAAWEEGGKVHARVLPDGAALTLSTAEAGQATLAAGGGKLYAAWAEQAGRFRRIVVSRLDVTAGMLRAAPAQPIEASLPTDGQGWPALAVAGDGSVTVAWEDRRDHHTVPLTSHSDDGRHFSPPVRLSDLPKDGGLGRSMGLGAGTGAMRPTLTAWGAQGVVAVWLDKRDFLSGYDVYAAFDPGTRRFGPNLKVQDSFGDNMAQWHAQVVGSTGGRLLALWDDARDGTPDVWLADWDGAAFGDNVAVPGAVGPGVQSDPAAALDAAGSLHVVWLDQDEQAGTRVRYAHAEWK